MAIAVDTTANSGVEAGVSSHSYSITIANQANRMLIVTVQTRDNDNPTNRPVTGITADGVAMTLAKAKSSTDTDGDDIRAEIWMLPAPNVGTITIALTYTGTVDHTASTALSLYNVKQTTLPHSTGEDEDTNGTATTDPDVTIVTTGADTMLIDSCYHQDGTSDLTVGAGQTVIAQLGTNGGGDRAISSYKAVAAAGSPHMQWTAAAQDAFVSVGIAVIGTAGSPSASPSQSPSASLSPSASTSPSVSPSASTSPSPSASPSVSPSASASPSAAPDEAPTVTTLSPVGSVLTNTAATGGTLVSDGGDTVTQMGVVVGTSINPTTSNTKFIASGTALGEYLARATGLLPNTTYHVRAYAINSVGTGYGADVTFTTRRAILRKTFYYKVYDHGAYKTHWTSEVINEPHFKTVINSGPGELTIELARPFDSFGEDVDVKLNNKVELYVVDEDAPNGQLIYTGYISGYKPVIRATKEYVSITVLGYAAELSQMILRDGSGNTTLAYNSYDPGAILRDVLDKYQTLGGSLKYTTNTVLLTNTVVSYTFNTNTIKECFDKIIELCPVGWYYRIQPDGYVYLQPRTVVADHIFTLGLNVENLETQRLMDNLTNRVLFVGGGDPPLFRKYENTGSQSTYGLREIKKVDQRVTAAATAQIISERIIEDKKDPEIRSKFTIVDGNGPGLRGYDIESVKPGQTLKVGNLRSGTQSISYWDQALWDVDLWDQTLSTSAADVIQILSVDYSADSIVIEASSKLPDIAKRIEDINRNLETTQTVNNPAAPS